MGLHNLYIDIDRSEAVRSASDSSIVSLPPLVQGDQLQLRIWLLTGYSQLSEYDQVPVSGITLEVAIGVKIGSVSSLYTQQFTWTPSVDLGQPYFSGTLPMNTAEITTLLSTSATASAWFEVKMITSALPVTILSEPVTIQAAVIKADSTQVPVPLTPLSAEAANASFVRVDHTGSFILRNATTGAAILVYCDDDGALRSDPIV